MVSKQLSIITHLENEASQRVALKAGFRLIRQFKGSDRYTRKMRDYLEFRFVKEKLMSKTPRNSKLFGRITGW